MQSRVPCTHVTGDSCLPNAWELISPHFAWQGDVLELSAGTGRNLAYYRFPEVKALTVTDGSRNMLWYAVDKFSEMRDVAAPVTFLVRDAHQLTSTAATEALNTSGKRWARAGAADAKPAEEVWGPGGRQFDTVVDTFGLCSHKDAVAVLQVRRKSAYGALGEENSLQTCFA
jgi:methyltransferase OMS1, mitochondrial